MWWLDLDNQRALSLPETHIDESANIHPTTTLDTTAGPIYIGRRTKVCAGAFIYGPAYIGDDCMIGNLAMIRGPVTLGHGVRIGFATELKNALLADNVTIGPQCFVSDSKVDEGAYLGAQVRTSNQRLDKKSVSVVIEGQTIDSGREKLGCWIGARTSLGIQCIVLPGRIVPADSLFAPRIIIEKNLPPGCYRIKQALETFCATAIEEGFHEDHHSIGGRGVARSGRDGARW